jgi:protein-disulfide isomerase
MKIVHILSALALAALLPAAGTTAKPVDWSRNVTLSPSGGHILGNPAAPTKVVEYVSYTCSHCAEFVKDATVPLKTQWVKRGTVSVEVRNLVRDGFDLTAALLARCGGKDRFMGNHEALFANFEAWIPQLQAYAPPQPAPADPAAQFRDVAQKTGLYTLMARRGFKPAQLDACLADTRARDLIVKMTEYATNTDNIRGTPGLLVNGTLVQGGWPALRAALPALPK